MKVLGQFQSFEYLFLPETRPPLVHDLGFDLRHKILCLLMHDGEKVLLPFSELAVMIANKNEQVFIRIEWFLVQIGFRLLLTTVNRAERIRARSGLID